MNKISANILIIDDDPAVLASAKLFLKQKFKFVITLPSPENLEKVLDESSIDLVLLDMNYTKGENEGKEGLALIEDIVRNHPGIEVLPITAYGEIDLAVEAMKRGARDFITKPWQNEKLFATISNLLDLRATKHENSTLQQLNKEVSQENTEQPIIGASRAIQQVLNTVIKVAPTDAHILISGENGTGKELIARELHQKSDRSDKPFVKVDLGALSASLFESELFGHVKGAFTDAKENRVGKLALADKGTIFLDEIGNITAAQQAKLLSVLQEKTVSQIGSNKIQAIDVRVVSATNANLPEMVKNGLFRQDLLYRINTIEIALPPLSDRTEDIPDLVNHYLSLFKSKHQKPALKINKETIEALKQHNWPGNIRELSHAVERAVILAEEPVLSASSFQLSTASKTAGLELDSLNIKEMEKSLILKALEKNHGNITHAAKDLGIDRLALYRRLEKYGL